MVGTVNGWTIYKTLRSITYNYWIVKDGKRMGRAVRHRRLWTAFEEVGNGFLFESQGINVIEAPSLDKLIMAVADAEICVNAREAQRVT